jgi:hypothetical protein
MKKYLVLSCLFFCFLSLKAQIEIIEEQEPEIEFTFFDELASSIDGQGKVRVIQDSRLNHLIAAKSEENKKKSNKDFMFINGYRVQVFSSNVPRTSKDEAFSMESAVREKISDTEVYISFTSPFWRVRVGDSKTYQEAIVLLNLLRNEFPKERNNFYIVKETIRVPVN